MYFFFNLTIKSPERPRFCWVAPFMFYKLLIVTLKTPLYVFRAELYWKVSQRLWSQWLSFLCFEKYPLFLKPVPEIKNISWCQEKWGRSANKMAYSKGTFLLWGFCVPSFRAIAYAIDKQNDTCRRYLLLLGLYVPSVKTTTYVYNRFNTSFCTKDHKTHLTISCYTLLQQAARGEGKNILRKHRDVLVSDRDQQRFFIIIIT